MSKAEFDELVGALYGAYVNIKRKRGKEPMEYRLFKVRMRIWEEW